MYIGMNRLTNIDLEKKARWQASKKRRDKKKSDFMRVSKAIHLSPRLTFANPISGRATRMMKERVPDELLTQILSYLEPVNKRTLKASVKPSQHLSNRQQRRSRRVKVRNNARQTGAGTRGGRRVRRRRAVY